MIPASVYTTMVQAPSSLMRSRNHSKTSSNPQGVTRDQQQFRGVSPSSKDGHDDEEDEEEEDLIKQSGSWSRVNSQSQSSGKGMTSDHHHRDHPEPSQSRVYTKGRGTLDNPFQLLHTHTGC